MISLIISRSCEPIVSNCRMDNTVNVSTAANIMLALLSVKLVLASDMIHIAVVNDY